MSYKLKVKGQYIKDLSFENQNSPQIFVMISKTPPEINISVNVSSVSLPVKAQGQENEQSLDNKVEPLYEVTLQVNAEARVSTTVAFICEVKYCGVFSIENSDTNNEEELSQQDMRDMLLVSAPSILFPFVRELISRVTATGGFPPLMLDVVDFKAMYESQIKQNADGQNDNGQHTEK
ncbi:protein-export chaperone SecB [Ehrlichia minasensis]|uniref:Protein-export protein SecB n=1 Tax=Ehrlichia minasensis TaxID=1242993 RepID=A0A4Q6IBZ0_9RICK|nr:protein-export chaperone SecB [Ehrlichia minasensis]RZB12808.1 protein-export chaperone SecB [Ehrlichia minasensis]CEI84935.1 Protein-export protein SecB [Ehrlichia minasensis]